MLATLAPPLHLSPQQVRVCILLQTGMTDKAVGRELEISKAMVRKHLEHAAERIHRSFPEYRGEPREVVRAWYVGCRYRAYFQHREAA